MADLPKPKRSRALRWSAAEVNALVEAFEENASQLQRSFSGSTITAAIRKDKRCKMPNRVNAVNTSGCVRSV